MTDHYRWLWLPVRIEVTQEELPEEILGHIPQVLKRDGVVIHPAQDFPTQASAGQNFDAPLSSIRREGMAVRECAAGVSGDVPGRIGCVQHGEM
jgi:hypothetical protein